MPGLQGRSGTMIFLQMAWCCYYDDIAYGDSLGRTAKFPRNAIAFKWQDEIQETTLSYIEWSPSRTGLIDPVAVFEPVELEGLLSVAPRP